MAVNYRDFLSQKTQNKLKGKSDAVSADTQTSTPSFSDGVYSLFDSLAQKYGFGGNGQQYLNYVFQSMMSRNPQVTNTIPQDVMKAAEGILKQAVVNKLVNQPTTSNVQAANTAQSSSRMQYGRLYPQPSSVPIPSSMQIQPENVPIPKNMPDLENMTVREANDLLFGQNGYFTNRGYNTTGALEKQRVAQQMKQQQVPQKIGGSQPMALKPSNTVGGYFNALNQVQASQPVKTTQTQPSVPKQQKPGDFIKSLQSNVKNIQSVVSSWFGKK